MGSRHRKGSAATGTGFDFTRHLRTVCDDMVSRLPDLAHIDFSRVAVSFSQARKRGHYGLHASLTPMRFENGSRVEKRRGRFYTTQRLLDPDGREMLYILSACLPRFMNVGFREKLTTIVHELWHISPRFNGDIRRHAGRCYAHSGSRHRYDQAMEALVDQWLECGPPVGTYRFLTYHFEELQEKHGRVYGTKIRRPKLILITAAEAQRIRQQEFSP